MPEWCRRFLLFTLLVPMVVPAFAERPVLRAGLEPFPPLINEDKTGYSIQWLRALADEAGMTLKLRIMPYSRAKLALKAGQVDLVGHTPFGLETKQFYEYAVELEQQVTTKMDAFSPVPENLGAESLHRQRIGVPFGNAAFIAELTGVPERQFAEASLARVVQMMMAGRVEVVVFERASVFSQLRHFEAGDIHYRLVKQIDAGFAVAREDQALLEKLNAAARRIDTTGVYQSYSAILDWPDQGQVPLSGPR